LLKIEKTRTEMFWSFFMKSSSVIFMKSNGNRRFHINSNEKIKSIDEKFGNKLSNFSLFFKFAKK